MAKIVFGNIYNIFLQIIYDNGLIVIVVNDHILKYNPAIWSH